MGEFNRLLQEGLLYDGEGFSGVRLRTDTQRLLERRSKLRNLVFLNRLLLEDAFSQIEKIQLVDTESLYRMPLNHLAKRTTGLYNEPRHRSYRLLKLHGSINWHYSGDENVAGQQVYLIPVDSDSPFTDSEHLRERHGSNQGNTLACSDMDIRFY